MGRVIPIILSIAVITAGCVSLSNSSSSTPSTSASASSTATSAETPTNTDSGTSSENTDHTDSSSTGTATPAQFDATGTSCNDDIWVDFWRTERHAQWSHDTVRVSYTIPPNESVVLVAYVDGNVEGARSDTNHGGSEKHVDGYKLQLRQEFTGAHIVQVAVFEDTNGNGQFEQETDSPCIDDDSVVQTGPRTFDFSQFG